MGFLDEVQELGWTNQSQQFPRVWYHNGIKQAGTASQWYTKQSETTASDPWVEVEKFEGEAGYVTATFSFAPIMMRSQAFMTEPDGSTKWLPHYEKGARIYTEYLSFIDGLPHPTVFIVKGLAGKAVNDAIKEFRKSIPKANEMPPWTFYIPLQVDMSKGKPVFQDTGRGAFVNLPVLREFTDESAYVGKELLHEGKNIMQEYAEWAKTRRGGTPVAQEQSESPQSSGEYEPF